jgi:predicted phage-related endonuclease
VAAPTGKRVPDRRAGIGASELGAIYGCDPYRTDRDVWLDKMGLSVPRPTTLIMEAGNALEPMIIKEMARRTGLAFHRVRAPRPHIVAPLFGTPDAVAGDTGLEVKTGRDRWDEIPCRVVKQAFGQMACWPRLERVIVARYSGDGWLDTFTVERDQEQIDLIVDRVMDWWTDHIIGGQMPSGLSDPIVITGPEITATDEDEKAWQQYRGLKATIAAMEMEAESIRDRLVDQQRDIAGMGWRGRWVETRTTSWKDVALDAGASEVLVEAHTRRGRRFDLRETR